MIDVFTLEILLAVFIAGYLLGSIPFGVLLAQAAGLGDIRKIGSGGTGATNVQRTGNKTVAAATLLLDALKGAAAVWIGAYVDGPTGAAVGGLAAVIGHSFPVWLGFKGGKGIATGFGVLLASMPLIAGICALAWLTSALVLRISSASSLIACALAAVLALALKMPLPLLVMTLLVTALVFERHKANIRRLLAGQEPRIGKSHRPG